MVFSLETKNKREGRRATREQGRRSEQGKRKEEEGGRAGARGVVCHVSAAPEPKEGVSAAPGPKPGGPALPHAVWRDACRHPPFGLHHAETPAFGSAPANSALFFKLFQNACYIPNCGLKKYYLKKNSAGMQIT